MRSKQRLLMTKLEDRLTPALVINPLVANSIVTNAITNNAITADVAATATTADLAQAAPQVSSVMINNGDAQRSRVESIQIVFDSLVDLPSDRQSAFELRRNSDGAIVPVVASVSDIGQTIVTLTFPGPQSSFGSLPDGHYTLTVFSDAISRDGISLDGNRDRIGGDNFVLNSSGSTGIYRLYGDLDGNGRVDATDLAILRIAMRTNSPALDLNLDGRFNATDMVEFRKRFGLSVA